MPTRGTGFDTRRFGLVFIGVGVLVALILGTIATVLLVRSTQRAHDWVSTEGVVVDVVATTNRDGGRLYRPVVAYTTPEGEFTCETNTSSSSRPAVGDTRTIEYDPALPTRCSIKGNGWVVWFLYGMGALFLMIFGGVGFAVARSGQSVQGETVEDENQRLRRQVSDLLNEREARRARENEAHSAGEPGGQWPTMDERAAAQRRPGEPQDDPQDGQQDGPRDLR